MNEYQLDTSELQTESDVELKVIYKLITNSEPLGLGFDSIQILTKASLKKILLDKGDKAITYYPDFVIKIDGIPLIVIEAKKPHEDLDEAFRQASLYAAEINRWFDTKINPCQLILACDGLQLFAGTWDNATPSFKISVENWNFIEKDFNDFCLKFSHSAVENFAKEVKSKLRKKARSKKPLLLIGGKYLQDKVTENSFGETISIQYRHLFNPDEEAERIDIVKNAYVRIKKHIDHVDPIERIIHKKIMTSVEQVTQIEDSNNPIEILGKLTQATHYNNQVLLIVGKVGSGKSTFLTYLREVGLDNDLKNNLIWITLNLNDVPVVKEEIYSWIKKNIISQIKDAHRDIDFDDINFIQSLYEDKLSSLRKGPLSLLNSDSDKYKELLVEEILKYQSDLDITLESYIALFIHNKSKNLIVVLDNCDKRDLEEQLLMFEVSNWIKSSIKAFVFLPIRDTTFDHFRSEKPLDTVVKDLVFRISPPSLEKVLFQRIKYANRLAEVRGGNSYLLPNGIRVSYPSEDELYYLKSILTSLFQNQFFKHLLAGLTGGNIRVGLEIFLDFCKSGYISNQDIFKMRQTKGEYMLPDHLITTVFLRGNRYYYSDASARIKNLFASDPSDDLPDPFVRIAILKWLNDRFRIKHKTTGITGFHPYEEIITQLTSLGHSKERVDKELLIMLRNSLIVNESQNSNVIDKGELLSINTPGIINLELLNDFNYLSSCAEDVWFNVESIANEIAQNMAENGKFSRLSVQNVARHTRLLIDYLQDYYQDYFQIYSEYLNEKIFSYPMDFKSLGEKIENLESKIKRKNVFVEFETNSIQSAWVTSIKDLGAFVDIADSGQIGLIRRNKSNSDCFEKPLHFRDKIQVKILKFNPEHNKYDLAFVNGEE